MLAQRKERGRKKQLLYQQVIQDFTQDKEGKFAAINKLLSIYIYAAPR